MSKDELSRKKRAEEISAGDQEPTGGQPAYHYVYFFTHGVVKRLTSVLDGLAEEGHIDKFIDSLELYCSDLMHIVKSPDREMIRFNVENITRSFRESLGFLKRIERSKEWIITRQEVRSRLQPGEDEVGRFLVDTAREARETIGPLEELTRLLDENLEKHYKDRHGRAAVDYSEFVILAVRKFEEFIGKPSPEKGGVFYKVIQIAFESVGAPYMDDPALPIKQAFKKLSGK